MSLFILFYGVVIIGIILYYFNIRSAIIKQHSQKILSIEQVISMHKTQLNYRNNGLQKYNFQAYNLNDSLQVQPEINLN